MSDTIPPEITKLIIEHRARLKELTNELTLAKEQLEVSKSKHDRVLSCYQEKQRLIELLIEKFDPDQVDE